MYGLMAKLSVSTLNILQLLIRLFFLLQFTWKDGEGAQITEGMTSETEEIENTKRITAISTLKLTVKKTYHNKNITCEAMQANPFLAFFKPIYPVMFCFPILGCRSKWIFINLILSLNTTLIKLFWTIPTD